MSARPTYHTPVLKSEVLELLVVNEDGTYLDGTLGGGGHFLALSERLSQRALLLGIDRDPDAIAWVPAQLPAAGPKTLLQQATFSEFDKVLIAHGIKVLDGVLLDLGVSSRQIDEAGRGFSYMKDCELDMRMNPSAGISAADLLESADEAELTRILGEYGEVQNPGRMASAVKGCVRERPIRTSTELRACLGREYGPGLQVRVLAKVFQALRIAVNDELGELRRFLDKIVSWMAPGARLAVIAYHSLEDRMVKQFMIDNEGACVCPPQAPVCTCARRVLLKRITRKAVKAAPDEISANPRARSARLRVAERTSEAA